MENPVIILGASGLGKVALDIFTSLDVVVYCFLDDDEKLHNTEIHEISVMGSPRDDGFLKYIGKKCEAFVAVEEKKERRELVKLLLERRKVMPVNAVHQAALISEMAMIGHGNLINAHAVLSAGAKIGNHCILHAKSLVEHDATLADFVQVGAGSIVGPRVKIGEGVLIGAGAILTAGITIGANAQVAPGSLVTQSVEPDDIVFGLPAKSL
jgi:sugar O-acyltransferase (sialic acid O-acetyltransferase NeuD family)